MESDRSADPLDFDYRIKPGISTRSSALAIVRMAGIENLENGDSEAFSLIRT